MVVSSCACTHVQKTLHLPQRCTRPRRRGYWHVCGAHGTCHLYPAPLPPETHTIGLLHPKDMRHESYCRPPRSQPAGEPPDADIVGSGKAPTYDLT